MLTDCDGGDLGHFPHIFIGLHDALDARHGEFRLDFDCGDGMRQRWLLGQRDRRWSRSWGGYGLHELRLGHGRCGSDGGHLGGARETRRSARHVGIEAEAGEGRRNVLLGHPGERGGRGGLLMILRGEEGRGVVGGAVSQGIGELVGLGDGGGDGGVEGGKIGRLRAIVVLICHCLGEMSIASSKSIEYREWMYLVRRND